MKKHINIPIFVPHLGCPNACVFCNQHKISGKESFVIENAEEELKKAFSTVDPQSTEAEIAFFGGSFTGIETEQMCSLLKLAQGYVDCGKAIGIRFSTRPDYISKPILDKLSEFTVKTVELGIQSVSDRVLGASRRGHSFAQTQEAVFLLQEYGFDWVGQMMIGLPASTLKDEIETATFICSNRASGARIYPTVVFADTDLHRMVMEGDYVPLDQETAVERSACVLETFVANSVPVIRIGLHSSENLADPESVFAGPNHPALGEMVMSRLYLHRMRALLRRKECTDAEFVTFAVAKGATSKALGQHSINRKKLCEEFSIKSLKIVENPNIFLYNIKLV